MNHVLVMAKAPVPGRVKTRLCPPCTPAQAAAIAAAALADTLDAAVASRADRVVLALDGGVDAWLPPGCVVIAQRGRTFADRLANAWSDTGGPGVQIGMDTPQLGAGDLDEALTTLETNELDAAIGLAHDGGWWALALRRPHPRMFDGIPMSAPETGRHQVERLAELGLRVGRLPVLRDVDTMADALAVAELAPATRFAAAIRRTLGAALAET